MNEALPFDLSETIETVVRSRRNGPLIRAAATLWILPGDLVVDVTFGEGGFWTDYRPATLVVHDLYKVDGVDFRDLPEPDRSVDVVVFDPPYIAQGGRESGGSIAAFRDRFGLDEGPRSTAELRELARDGIAEAARVLKPSGRLLVKTMNYINGRAFVQGQRDVVTAAEEAGLVQVDEFVHVSGTGPPPPGRKVQVHARRAHSFLCVFQARPVWQQRPT
jgi:tRNA G10  N-methylase Trm11